MHSQHRGRYAIALAVLIVGLVAVGVPVSTVMYAALVLACPLMMIFMHGGHGGGHRTGDHRVEHPDQASANGRQ